MTLPVEQNLFVFYNPNSLSLCTGLYSHFPLLLIMLQLFISSNTWSSSQHQASHMLFSRCETLPSLSLTPCPCLLRGFPLYPSRFPCFPQFSINYTQCFSFVTLAQIIIHEGRGDFWFFTTAYTPNINSNHKVVFIENTQNLMMTYVHSSFHRSTSSSLKLSYVVVCGMSLTRLGEGWQPQIICKMLCNYFV